MNLSTFTELEKVGGGVQSELPGLDPVFFPQDSSEAHGLSTLPARVDSPPALSGLLG
jgi:hypothetical protein